MLSMLIKKNALIVFFILVLIPHFYMNLWFGPIKILNDGFIIFHEGSQQLVMDKILASKLHGVFYQQGFLLIPSNFGLHIPFFANFSSLGDFYSYVLNSKPYLSSSGLQGILGSLLVYVIPNLKVDFIILWLINSICMSLVCGLFFKFAEINFGKLAMIFCFVITFFSPWLLVFGEDLFWNLWFLFIPCLLSLYYLALAPSLRQRYKRYYLGIIFMAILLKGMQGFEFISSMSLSAMLPFVYFYLNKNIYMREGLSLIFSIAFFTVLGFILACVILAVQIDSLQKSGLSKNLVTTNPAGVIFFDVQKRLGIGVKNNNFCRVQSKQVVYQNSCEAIDASIKASYLTVIKTYLQIPIVATINALELIIFSSICAVLAYFLKMSQRLKSLFWLATTSIISPISWYVLAKPHSYIHVHLDPVLWSLPFLFFEAMFLGAFFSDLIKNRTLSHAKT